MSIDADMVDTFQTELELCGVGPGTLVAALSEGDVRTDFAQATLIAARALGAQAFHMNLAPAHFGPRGEQCVESLAGFSGAG